MFVALLSRMSQEPLVVGPFSVVRLCAGLQWTEATLDLSLKHRHLRYTPGVGMMHDSPAAAAPSTAQRYLPGLYSQGATSA